MACATDAIVANANGEHLDEALEVLDYIGDGGDWLKTVTNSYGGFMACMDIEADDEIASKDYYKDLKQVYGMQERSEVLCGISFQAEQAMFWAMMFRDILQE